MWCREKEKFREPSIWKPLMLRREFILERTELLTAQRNGKLKQGSSTGIKLIFRERYFVGQGKLQK